jgi:hypothetical protein
MPAPLGAHLLGDVPAPVLFNTWKHHAGALRRRLSEYAAAGETGLADLAAQLAVQGHELMDLYFGTLTPADIAVAVVQQLRDAGRLEPELYRAWVAAQGGYGMLTLADDSRWVLRPGDESDRYIHVHPGRWAPQTRRVRANVLKTAVLVNAAALVRRGDPLDVKLINQVRQKYLGLAPVRGLSGDQGLAPVIELLRPE